MPNPDTQPRFDINNIPLPINPPDFVVPESIRKPVNPAEIMRRSQQRKTEKFIPPPSKFDIQQMVEVPKEIFPSGIGKIVSKEWCDNHFTSFRGWGYHVINPNNNITPAHLIREGLLNATPNDPPTRGKEVPPDNSSS